MRKYHLKSSPEPERMSVRLTDLEVCAPREDGQHEYTAIAQFFNQVNDRLMIFRKGAFAKTIAEQLGGSGPSRIKINDAHRHTSAMTLGTVVEAEERDVGLWYRGLISSTEAGIFTKMGEGHVDENSIEFFSMVESTTRVPLSDVPAGAFIWEENKGDGTVEAREMLEVAWVGIAILPASSQGRRALLEFNCAVPFQDLPVADPSTAWDAESAKQRLEQWAGNIDQLGGDRGSFPHYAKLARGHLVRGPIQGGQETFLGQIADVVDGQLVVVPEALDVALADLAGVEQLGGPDFAAIAANVGRYREKLRYSQPARKVSLAAPACDPEADALSSNSDSAVDPAGPAPDTSAAPPTEETDSDAAVASPRYAGQRLKLMSLRLDAVAAKFPEVSNLESARTSREPSPGGSSAV